MDDITQIQTRVDIEQLHAQTPSTANRRSDNSESYDSSFKQKGDTTRSRNKKLRPTKKLKKQTSMTCVALKMKAVTDLSTTTDNDVDIKSFM